MRKETDEKAWADASRAGTVEAFPAYLEAHGSGAHAGDARQRLSVLEERARKTAEEQARREAEEKAWADASRAGTVEAIAAYLQTHGSGIHAAEARQRLAVLEKEARADADEKAWTDASAAGTVAAISSYLQSHGSAAHATEARQRFAVLEEEARKVAEEKVWADASRAGTIAAITAYLQNYGSGAHAAEARRRLSALEDQARRREEALRKGKASAIGLPTIDLRNVCGTSADVSGAPRQKADDSCIKSEEVARDGIAKQWTEFSTADRVLCVDPKVYQPSYVEWLTCLEMQRDVGD